MNHQPSLEEVQESIRRLMVEDQGFLASNPVILDYYRSKLQLLPPRIETHENITISLPKSECDIILPDACGICLENHKKRETVLCGCNHAFGGKCLNKWTKMCKKSKKGLTCPLCRDPIIKTTNYAEGTD